MREAGNIVILIGLAVFCYGFLPLAMQMGGATGAYGPNHYGEATGLGIVMCVVGLMMRLAQGSVRESGANRRSAEPSGAGNDHAIKTGLHGETSSDIAKPPDVVAMTPCRVCGRNLSPFAESCPGCGDPAVRIGKTVGADASAPVTAPELQAQTPPDASEPFPKIEKVVSAPQSNTGPVSGYAIFGWLALLALFGLALASQAREPSECAKACASSGPFQAYRYLVTTGAFGGELTKEAKELVMNKPLEYCESVCEHCPGAAAREGRCERPADPAQVEADAALETQQAAPKDSEQRTRWKMVQKAACDGGKPKACTSLGLAMIGEVWPFSDERNHREEASIYLKRGCDGDDAVGCTWFGRANENRVWYALDRPTAVKLFQRGCDLGGGEGCALLASELIIDGDWPASIRITQRACDLGDEASCIKIASYYENGMETLPRDEAKARGLVEKVYAQNQYLTTGEYVNHEAFLQLARYAALGIGKPRDFPLANRIFADWQRLTPGSASALSFFGYADVTDASAAVSACRAGDGAACTWAGWQFEAGVGTPPDAKTAGQYYAQGCTHKNALGCHISARIAIGSGLNARARKLFKQACGLGDHEACSAEIRLW